MIFFIISFFNGKFFYRPEELWQSICEIAHRLWLPGRCYSSLAIGFFLGQKSDYIDKTSSTTLEHICMPPSANVTGENEI